MSSREVVYGDVENCIRRQQDMQTCTSSKPAWLDTLLQEKFFAACTAHAISRKNETNIFCLDCLFSICQHCLISSHNSHQVLQIRRYVYHDVIRLHDMQKLIDCSRVQAYTINGARVLFLKERPQPKSNKGLASNCESCERSLQDAYKFCSVACKVEHAFTTKRSFSSSSLRGSRDQHQMKKAVPCHHLDDEAFRTTAEEHELSNTDPVSTISSESTQSDTYSGSPNLNQQPAEKLVTSCTLLYDHHQLGRLRQVERRYQHGSLDVRRSDFKPRHEPRPMMLNCSIMALNRRKCRKPQRSPLL